MGSDSCPPRSGVQFVAVDEPTLRPFLEGNHDEWLCHAGLTEFSKLGWRDEGIPDSLLLQFLGGFSGDKTRVNGEEIDISSKALSEIFRLQTGRQSAYKKVSHWTSSLAPNGIKEGDSYVMSSLPDWLRERIAFLKATLHMQPESSNVTTTIVRQAEDPDRSWEWVSGFAEKLWGKWKLLKMSLNFRQTVFSTSHIRIILKHYERQLPAPSVHRRVDAVLVGGMLNYIPQDTPSNEDEVTKKRKRVHDVEEARTNNEGPPGTGAAGGGEPEIAVHEAMRNHLEFARRLGYGFDAALGDNATMDVRRVINENVQAFLWNSMSPEEREAVDLKVAQLEQELAKTRALLHARRNRFANSKSVADSSLPSNIDTEVQTFFPAEENAVPQIEGGANSGKEQVADAQQDQTMAQDRHVTERQSKEVAAANKEHYDKQEDKIKRLESDLAKTTRELGEAKAQLGRESKEVAAANKEHYDKQEEKIKRLESDLAKTTRELGEAKAQLGSTQTVTEELGSNAGTTAELEGHKKRVRELETELESSMERELALNEALRLSKLRVRHANDRAAGVETKAENDWEKLAEVSTQTVTAELEDYKKRVRELQTELGSSKEREMKLNDQLGSSNSRLWEANKRLFICDRRMAELDSDRGKAQKDLVEAQRLHAIANTRFAAQTKQLQDDRDINERLLLSEQMRAQAEHDAETLKEENLSSLTTIRHLQEDIRTLQDEAADPTDRGDGTRSQRGVSRKPVGATRRGGGASRDNVSRRGTR